MRKSFVAAAAAGLATIAAFAAPAMAQYPDKPVSFVVPFPPGDPEDVLTRMIAEDFQKEYGTAAAVVNKPGGGGGPFPGAVEVANAPADGYTVGSFVIDVPVVGPHIDIPELNPNPFEPLGIFLTYPFVIVAYGDAPYDSMEELAEYARNNDVVLGHFGNFLIPTQVTMALAKSMDFSYSADAAFDALDCNTLASGDVDVMNGTLQSLLPCIDDIKVLATVTDKRIPLVPDAPTVGEIEPDLDVALWNGLFVHKDVPQEARDAIVAVAKKTMESGRAQGFATETGTGVYWQGAEEAAARIAKDEETLGRIEAMLAE